MGAPAGPTVSCLNVHRKVTGRQWEAEGLHYVSTSEQLRQGTEAEAIAKGPWKNKAKNIWTGKKYLVDSVHALDFLSVLKTLLEL